MGTKKKVSSIFVWCVCVCVVCTGPLYNTVGDFWRMIWENDVQIIVMLTNFFENGRVSVWDYGDLLTTLSAHTQEGCSSRSVSLSVCVYSGSLRSLHYNG